MDKLIKKILDIPRVERSEAYQMGHDCGLNGPNEKNCHFSIFSSRENTKEWERGKEQSLKGE